MEHPRHDGGDERDPAVRSPAHMAAVLEQIQAFWINHPTLRLTQVIALAAGHTNPSYASDPYYCRDVQLLDGFRGFERRVRGLL